MNDFWDNCDGRWYNILSSRHLTLHRFVARFITDFDIKSMVEVGGAYGKWRKLVDDYTCIELNKKAYEKMKDVTNYIYGDFHKIDMATIPKEKDLFIALAVVEHCNGYKEFLKRAIELNPKYIIINFFRGLSIYDEDKFKIKTKNNKPYYLNRYSRKVLYDVLEEFGVLDKSIIVNIKCETDNKQGEDVLIINLQKEVESSLKINKIMEEIK